METRGIVDFARVGGGGGKGTSFLADFRPPFSVENEQFALLQRTLLHPHADLGNHKLGNCQ